MTRRRLYMMLLILWVMLTILLTSIPNPGIEISIPFSDKIAHFAVYGVMGFLCAMWRRECNIPPLGAVLAAAAFVAVTGGLDEIHQYWIPGRSMDLFDWIADSVGGGFGAMISAFLPALFPFLLTE